MKELIFKPYIKLLFIGLFLVPELVFSTDFSSVQNGNFNDDNTWSGVGTPDADDNITITHTVTLTADGSVNDVVINGGSLNISSFELIISGALSGTASNNFFSTSASSLNIAGAGAQFTFPSNIIKLKKLTINRANGAYSDHTLDLDDAIPADSIILVLTNGILTIETGFELQLKSHAVETYISNSNASFVDGKIVRFIAKGNGWTYFPVGDGSRARMVGLKVESGAASADNENSVQFHNLTTPDYLDYDAGSLPGGVFKKYYWEHINLGSNVYKRLYYADGDMPSGTNESDLRIADYDLTVDSQWDIAQAAAQQTPSPAGNYVEFNTANASIKSGWTFGSINAASPLPVELTSFKGTYSDGKVSLEWKTASEKNSKLFTIQQSTDNKNFSDLGSVPAKGNSKKTSAYSYTDISAKTIRTYYYRLKQVDLDGSSKFSSTISVTNDVEMGEMEVSSVYPNPVAPGSSSTKINITLPSDGKVSVMIYSMTGQLVKQVEQDMLAGVSVLEIPTDGLASGNYVYSIKFNLKSISGKFTRLSSKPEEEKTDSLDVNVDK